ncbi:MAG: hypothetical protein AAB407_00205 [Patescibacteria group bacterium]
MNLERIAAIQSTVDYVKAVIAQSIEKNKDKPDVVNILRDLNSKITTFENIHARDPYS